MTKEHFSNAVKYMSVVAAGRREHRLAGRPVEAGRLSGYYFAGGGLRSVQEDQADMEAIKKFDPQLHALFMEMETLSEKIDNYVISRTEKK